MGVEDYLLTSTISGVIAQRLVRTLCPHCRKPYDADLALLARLNIDSSESVTLYAAGGCASCGGTGFLGRSTIAEVLTMSDTLRHLVLSRAEATVIRKAAADEGMLSMHANGMRKVLVGLTTVEEVLRATRST